MGYARYCVSLCVLVLHVTMLNFVPQGDPAATAATGALRITVQFDERTRIGWSELRRLFKDVGHINDGHAPPPPGLPHCTHGRHAT